VAKIVKDSLGKFIAVKEDGTRVPVDPSWVAQSEGLPKKPASTLTPGQQVAQQAGLSPEGAPSPDGESPMIVRNEADNSMFGIGMRNLVKNWSSSPDQAMQMYRDSGYDVKPYGDHALKMQFAIRPKGTNGVWKPVDPDGFDWQDMLDHFTDVAGGAALTMAIPSGASLPTEAAATSGASAALEAAKEAGGAAMGIKDNISPGQIATAGVVGAAVPVAAKLVSPVTRLIGRPLAYGFEKLGGGIRMAALRMMGAKAEGGMGIAEADAILRNVKGKTIVPIPEQARAVSAAVNAALKADWPEAAQMNDMLVQARNAGAKIDFNPIIEGIENAAGAVERRAAGAARPVMAEGETFAARQGGLRPGAPSMEEFQQSPLGQRMRRMDIARQGTVAESSPGLKDFEEEFRKGMKGEAFKTPPTPSEIGRISPAATLRVPAAFDEGAGMASGAKRGAIAGHEANFGAPGAFGAPGDIEEKLSSGAARAEFRDPGLRKELLSFAGNLVKRLSNQSFRISEVPVDFANVVKQDLQALARRGGAYAGKSIEDAFTNVMSDAASNLRSGIMDAMPGEIQQDFAKVMGSFESKTKLAQAVLKMVKDPESTEAWLREIGGNSNSSGLRYLQQLEDHFGIKILPDLREAQAKEIIGKGNIQNFAQKHPYLAAAAIFHPETALPAVGGLAVAPAVGKGLTAAGRGIAAGTEVAARAAERLAASPAAKAAAVKIIQDNVSKSGKGIASESQASVAAKSRPRRVTRLF
jgi:hypothetical protein